MTFCYRPNDIVEVPGPSATKKFFSSHVLTGFLPTV